MRLLVPLLIAFISCGSVGIRAADSDIRVQAEELVQQLGAPRFMDRELAMADLIEIGLPALPSVQQASTHADREIRYRAKRIARIIRQLDRQRVIDAFIAGVDVEEEKLPGWIEFQTVLGGEPAARSLYVEMLEAEGAFLEEVFDDPDDSVEQKIDQRARSLQRITRYAAQRLDVGSIATLLFLIGLDNVDASDFTMTIVYTFCYRPEFHEGTASDAYGATLLRLLSRTITKGSLEGSLAQRLSFSLQFGLKEGLVPARDLLKQRGGVPVTRQQAILVLAKMGDVNDIPLIEQQLDDADICSNVQGRGRWRTQVRDVALAAVLHLTDQDLSEFGFSNVQAHPTAVFDVRTLGFKDDDSRTAAVKAWRESKARAAAVGG